MGDGPDFSLARRAAPVAIVVGLLCAGVVSPSAIARRAPSVLRWRLVGPATLAAGPHFRRAFNSVESQWLSSGSGPVLSTGARSSLAVWAGPNGEVDAASSGPSGDAWHAGTAAALAGTTGELVSALDPEGDALIGWSSRGAETPGAASAWQIGTTMRGAGGAVWGAPALVSSTTSYGPTAPAVGFDPGGDGFAVWAQPGGAGVLASYMPARVGTWQTPVVISPGLAPSRRPQLAVDSAGDATAVWEFAGSRVREVAAATYIAGHGWGAPVDLGPAGAVSVVAAPGRKALAVWRIEGEGEEPEKKSSLVYAFANLATGNWSQTYRLATNLQAQYGIAVAGNKERVVWWTTASKVGARETLMARVQRRGRGWSPQAVVASWRRAAEPAVPVNPTCDGTVEPLIAFDAHDDAIATWEQGCGAAYAARLAAGSTRWSKGGNITRIIGKRVAPVFALRPNGELVAAWLERGTVEPPSASGEGSGEGLQTTVVAAALVPVGHR